MVNILYVVSLVVHGKGVEISCFLANISSVYVSFCINYETDFVFFALRCIVFGASSRVIF